MPPTSVACRSSLGRTSANMPAAARPSTFDGSARRRSRFSASRVSVALRVSCTSRCLMNTSGLGFGLGLGLRVLTRSCECRVSSERRGLPARVTCSLGCMYNRMRRCRPLLFSKWSAFNSCAPRWRSPRQRGSEGYPHAHPSLQAFAESVSTSHQASSACARANPERSSSMSSIGGTASSLQSKRTARFGVSCVAETGRARTESQNTS